MSRYSLVGWALVAALLTPGFQAVSGQDAKAKDFSPFVFAVLSDPQIGMVAPERDRLNFAKVVEAINTTKPETKPQLAFIAGDLINQPRNQEQAALFNEVRKTFTMPVYLAPGNHDVAAGGKHFERALLDNYRRNVGQDKFVVEHGGCLFIGLNSQLWVDGADLAKEQYDWLAQRLQSRKHYRYVFIIQHHPLYLAAADEKEQYFNTPLVWRSKLLQLFVRAKVTAVLTGHLHRNLSGNYRGVAMLTTPSTCRNFDGSAFGYRLITVTADGFTEQYIGVPGTLPDEQRTSPPTSQERSSRGNG